MCILQAQNFELVQRGGGVVHILTVFSNGRHSLQILLLCHRRFYCTYHEVTFDGGEEHFSATWMNILLHSSSLAVIKKPQLFVKSTSLLKQINSICLSLRTLVCRKVEIFAKLCQILIIVNLGFAVSTGGQMIFVISKFDNTFFAWS